MMFVAVVIMMFWKQKKLLLALSVVASLPLVCAEEDMDGSFPPSYAQEEKSGYYINFHDVPVIEFIRFVSRISKESFIYDTKNLNFKISLSTGKEISEQTVINALIQLLRVHGFYVQKQGHYYVIHEVGEEMPSFEKEEGKKFETIVASNDLFFPKLKETYEFFSYKIQYHEGSTIEETLKKIAADLKNQPDAPAKLIQAIQSLQWVKATNSLLCSADPETLLSLRKLIESVDVPLRQVFIEVLVIETDVRKGMEFGLQWAASGKYKDRIGGGFGNFDRGTGGVSPFAGTMQGVGPGNTPTGLSQIPLVPGFDMGVIGDIIMHKGKSFLSLGSLVSALQIDGESTIVLNQKIITQDSKNSTIFVGDNIPFTGSVVQTVGQGQQTTANLEYRDVGVSLSITPRLGEGDIITLDLNEEITESLEHDLTTTSNVNGIRTTKTNMATHAHVPDKHFLVLSGMIRNHKEHHKSGLPCLGGLPVLGALFSKTRENNAKRNIIIFVRPHIIRSFLDYNQLTQHQENVFGSEAGSPADFQKGIDLVKPLESDLDKSNRID